MIVALQRLAIARAFKDHLAPAMAAHVGEMRASCCQCRAVMTTGISPRRVVTKSPGFATSPACPTYCHAR